MRFPSSNTDGRNAALNDIVSNVDSSHGVHLTGGSTGGIVQPVGDDANITLRVRGKGSAGVILSTGLAVQGFNSTTFAWAVAALSSGATEEVTLASTTADVNPGDLVSIELGLPAVSTQTLVFLGHRTSTVASSRVTITIGNITSTAVGSSASGTGRISWVDLT